MTRSALLVCLCLTVAACSESPKQTAKTAEPEKPAEAVTGLTAFHRMFMTARTWAGDVQGLSMRNIPLEQIKAEPGKSGAWEATFVSASKAQAKTFTYSVIEAGGNLHKDVFAGLAEAWSGPRGQQQLWPIQALKKDSTTAWELALEHSKEYAAKNRDKPISFLLEQTPRHPELVWRVIWGESAARSNYSVLVGASSGTFLERLR
ncbi:MAG TPA: hypothetical protein VFL57_07825 [Bryobacteraceae bacterium]|nr:hypothetical protein [Bryobacteraceae bacterium]